MLETIASAIAVAGLAVLPFALLEIAAHLVGPPPRDGAVDRLP